MGNQFVSDCFCHYSGAIVILSAFLLRNINYIGTCDRICSEQDTTWDESALSSCLISHVPPSPLWQSWSPLVFTANFFEKPILSLPRQLHWRQSASMGHTSHSERHQFVLQKQNNRCYIIEILCQDSEHSQNNITADKSFCPDWNY